MEKTANDLPAPEFRAPRRRIGLWIGLLLLAAIYVVTSRPPPSKVPWTTDLAAALNRSAAEKRWVLVDFYMTGCPPCESMDAAVFSRGEAAIALEQWIAVKVNGEVKRELRDRYGVAAYPTFVVLSPEGREAGRLEGSVSLEEFAAFLLSAQRSSAGGTQPAS